tara:strand:+ start:275 stop:757 length:483 start_codon:yes stop_codon:yes gene_type:complete
MTDDKAISDAKPLSPQVVEAEKEIEDPSTFIMEPSKLIRIASMTRAMLDEVRQSPLDEAGRVRLLQIYQASMDQLTDTLSEDLQEELASIFGPLEQETASESELRIVQAQLVGWLEGLFHGIQASLWSQQTSAAHQLEEMRRRHALEAANEEHNAPGLYL